MTGTSPNATASTHHSPTLPNAALSNLKRSIRRDQAIVVVVMVILTAFCWWSLISSSSGPNGEVHRHVPTNGFLLTLSMWVLMMIGMMTPSVFPFLRTLAGLARRRTHGNPFLLMATFFFGYCLVWTAFSAIAAAAQIALQASLLLSPVSMSLAPAEGGALMIAVGGYQWTSAKDACLRNCRSPLGFFISEWRERALGAWIMGIHHGVFCLGCCLLVMFLPFVAGVMNLTWMVGITIFVLLEKTLPGGKIVARVGGIWFALYGAWVIWRTL